MNTTMENVRKENMKSEKERLEQQIRFITEVDKVKNIFRQTYLADGKRKETTRSIPGTWRSRLSF